ncbi:putative Ig domain-containing protein [Spirosoma sp. KNUC1025]|uniref:putative Ig domain-containing protein n=1 Tax=Spirosoma sp. KNUC1025 TaxID=2894082 RepID=UPI00386ADFFA|nr:putative Ig domain-containing protein [Spirosoma sp. KNUC1025]
MILDDAKIVMTTGGYGNRGFTFAILGPIGTDGIYPERTQYENPVFARDQANNFFQSGVVYLLTAEHPDYVPDPELVRIVFSEDGTYKAVSPDEENGTGGGGHGSGVTPNLQAVTNVGNATTLPIIAESFKRQIKNFVSNILGISVWKQDGALESVEKISLDALKQLLAGQVASYNAAITINNCTQIAGYLFNPADSTTPAKAKIYIDGAFVSDVIATATLPSLAAQYGINANALIGWVFDIPQSYQNNLVHTIELRNFDSGGVLANVFTPGTCGIQTTIQPVWVFDGYDNEIAATPGQNLPPTVTNPQNDTEVTQFGDTTLAFPVGEFTDNGDTLTYNTTGWNGTAPADLPAGVVANNTFQTLFIPGSINAPFVVRRSVVDTAGQIAAYLFLITFDRQTTNSAYVIQRFPTGATQLLEGGGEGVFWVQENLSDGTQRTYSGGFKSIGWDTPYPNGMAVSPHPTQANKYVSKILPFTLESDVLLTLRFVLPDNTPLTLPVQALNAGTLTNQAPILNTPLQWTVATMGQSFSYPLNPSNHFTDPDGDAITMSLQVSNDGGQTFTSSLPGWLSVSSGNYGGTPPTTAQSQYILRLRRMASDGKGGTAYDDFNLIVNNVAP